jgi:hypothetical protein
MFPKGLKVFPLRYSAREIVMQNKSPRFDGGVLISSGSGLRILSYLLGQGLYGDVDRFSWRNRSTRRASLNLGLLWSII